MVLFRITENEPSKMHNVKPYVYSRPWPEILSILQSFCVPLTHPTQFILYLKNLLGQNLVEIPVICSLFIARVDKVSTMN